MKSNQTKFTIDKDKGIITIEREFTTTKERVWGAWTDAKILDKWWAPKPWKSETKHMELVEGGKRIYAMKGLNGEIHWAMKEFIAVKPNQNLKFKDSFCENEEVVDSKMPSSEWSVNFLDFGQFSQINITIQHENSNYLTKNLEMGFEEGFKMALNNLDEVLENR